MKRPYDSQLWRKTRREVLHRDGFICQLRLPGCRHRADAVHHREAWSEGGDAWSMENLIAVCTPCNSREAAYRRKAREEGRVRRPAPGPSEVFTGGTAYPPAPPPSRVW